MSKNYLRNIFLIFTRDFQEYRKKKIMWIFIAFFLIGSIICGSGMISVANQIQDTNSAKGQEIWLMILGNVLVLYSIIPQIISIPLFSTTPLTYEKANGVVMSLLATEMKPSQIWIGKSLAIFFPGLVASMGSLLIMLPCFMTIITIPISVILCAFLILPISMLLLSMITVQIAMIKSVEKAIAPSYILGFLLLAVFPAGSFTGAYLPGSMAFTMICLVILAFFLLIELMITRKTTIEKIILARVN